MRGLKQYIIDGSDPCIAGVICTDFHVGRVTEQKNKREYLLRYRIRGVDVANLIVSRI